MNPRVHKSATIRKPVKLTVEYKGSGGLETKGEGSTHDAIRMLFVTLAMMIVDNINPGVRFDRLCEEATNTLATEMEIFYEEANDHATKKN